MSLLAELRRRQVFRAAAWYGGFAWAAVEIANTVFPQFGLPSWSVRAVIVAALLGFPVVLVLAWFLDVSLSGIRREADVSPAASTGGPTTGSTVAAPAAAWRSPSLWIALALGFGLTLSAQQAWQRLVRPSGSERPSIAVLPFANLSPDEANAFENLLGKEGEGFKIAMTVLDAGRTGIATQALGIAEAAYEAAKQYAAEREAFGQPIGAFQGTGFKLADMKTRIEASRLLIYNAALAKEKSKKDGGRYSLEASMAKLFSSETAMFVTHQTVQIHGGMGYSKELPVERYFRDAKITEIYEGTSEIQRLVISRSELGFK